MPETVEIGDRLSLDIRPTPQLPFTSEKAPGSVGAAGTRGGDEDLPRVADSIPVSVWLVILISTLERFAFFGLREPFRKFTRDRGCVMVVIDIRNRELSPEP